MIKKVSEMEQAAYNDYADSVARHGEDDHRTKELEYRWKGMLEVKQELLRMAKQKNDWGGVAAAPEWSKL